MYNILQKMQQSGKMISVHFKDSASSSDLCVGYVEHLDKEIFVLRSITRYGEQCGFEVRRIDNVQRIEHSGNYETGLEKVHLGGFEYAKNVKLDFDPDNVISSILASANTSNQLITIWTSEDEDSISGYIDSYSPELLDLCIISDDGVPDGHALINPELIESVDTGGRYEQMLQYVSSGNA